MGGQGILLASEILAQAAMIQGYQVKTNEVHGMAQRGGSVMAQIRYGEEVKSPLVARRSAHILGALEKVEALRYWEYLRPDGLAAVSSQAIVPVTVSSGSARYPENVEDLLGQGLSPAGLYRCPETGEGAGRYAGRLTSYYWERYPGDWTCPRNPGRRPSAYVSGRSSEI